MVKTMVEKQKPSITIDSSHRSGCCDQRGGRSKRMELWSGGNLRRCLLIMLLLFLTYHVHFVGALSSSFVPFPTNGLTTTVIKQQKQQFQHPLLSSSRSLMQRELKNLSELGKNQGKSNGNEYKNNNIESSIPTPVASNFAISKNIPEWKSKLTKLAMMMYMTSMCVVLPFTLSPIVFLNRLGMISRNRKESWILSIAGVFTRSCLRMFPFSELDLACDPRAKNRGDPQPCVWVCNVSAFFTMVWFSFF